jgi:eukaryotic-like serine/threonine-protein kinase
MELRIGDRYQLTYAIQSLADGVLYAGKELFLQRDVIIFISNNKEEQGTEDLQRGLGQASHFNNKNFFHMLNAGIIDGHVYVVFTSYAGKPLIQSIQYHTQTSREILSMIYDLGTSMHNAAEENLFSYKVSAENIWLTNDNHLKVINYWTPVHADQTNSSGLCLLMYQLCAKTSEVPKTYEAIEYEILRSMKDLSPKQLEKLTALIRRVFRGDNSLVTFVLSLHEILEIRESVINKAVNMVSNEPPVKAERITKQEQQPIPKQATNYRAYRDQYLNNHDHHNEVEDEDGYIDDDDSYEEPKRSWTNKIKWIAGIIVALLIFVGTVVLVFMLLTSSNPEEKQEPNRVPQVEATIKPESTSEPTATLEPAETIVPTSSPKPDSNQAVQPSDNGENTNNGGEQEAISVPNLIGLTLKEAEKEIGAAGLRYNYEKKNSDAPEGTVFKQEPEAGASIAKGDRITITVSREKK